MNRNKESESKYVKFYNSVEEWFKMHTAALKILKFLYKYLPFLVGCVYMYLIGFCLFGKDKETFFKIVLVPLAAFLIVSVLRKVINFPRPYTKYPINPLIKKNKTGESMPSRHMLSITIIAMAWLFIYAPMGIILWCLAIIMGIIRILAGVHFPQDIAVAAIISIVIGYIGFWLI